MDGLQTRLLKTKYMLTSAAKYWWHNADLQSIMQNSLMPVSTSERKTFEWIILKKSIWRSGATPIGCTSGAPHGLSFQAEIVPTSKAKDKIKRPTLNQDAGAQMEIISGKDLRVDCFLKSTQRSGATPIGCTFDAPKEVQNLIIQNADF